MTEKYPKFCMKNFGCFFFLLLTNCIIKIIKMYNLRV